jgi:hypothetical protein
MTSSRANYDVIRGLCFDVINWRKTRHQRVNHDVTDKVIMKSWRRNCDVIKVSIISSETG